MFGRHHDKEASKHSAPVEAPVEVHLEWDCDAVQQAVVAFLQHPSEGARQSLLTELETLDDQIDASDTYEASVVDSPIFGFSSKGDVIGETNNHPASEEVPGAVLKAQIAMVRAAKTVIRDPGPDTIEALRTASDALAGVEKGPGVPG